MSAFAIVLGVAFVAGTFVFTDTLNSSFTELFRQTAPDVTVRPAKAAAAAAGGFTGADTRAVPAAHRRRAGRPGRGARADGSINDQGTYIIGKDGKVARQRRRRTRHRRQLRRRAGGRRLADRHHHPGRAPAGPDEVVIDEKTAATAGYQLGDTVQLVTSGEQPSVTGTLVGTVRFGQTGNLVGATLVLLDTPTAQTAVPGRRRTCSTTSPSPATGRCPTQQLRDEVTAALPAGFRGRRRRADRRREPEPAAAGTVVHHHLPAGVRRGRAGRRHLPDPEHVLDHRGPTHPGTGPVPGAGRVPTAGDPVGAVRGIGDRPDRVDRRAGPGFRAWPPGSRRCSARSASTSAGRPGVPVADG